MTEPLGPRLFARYAYAPNRAGYCGPADTAALFELAATGRTEADIRAIAARFSGAWPYLTVLAELAGIADPLDERVVRAYWTGGPLLKAVDRAVFGAALIERISAAGASRYWAHLSAGLLSEAAPTHAFHVFGVYPWSRLLSEGPGGRGPAESAGPALHVLDSCRIRWGQVVSAYDDRAVVRANRLTWDGRRLGLGPEREETVRLTEDGYGFVSQPRPGEWLALHWDWACDRLTDTDLSYLRRCTDWQLAATSTRLTGDATGARR